MNAAEKRNREDVDRQLEMLARAYRNAGKPCDVTLHFEQSSTRGYGHYRLTVDGFEVTSWGRAKTVDVWLSLFDMRRAVEVLDARIEVQL
jgi:hypothetical protein